MEDKNLRRGFISSHYTEDLVGILIPPSQNFAFIRRSRATYSYVDESLADRLSTVVPSTPRSEKYIRRLRSLFKFK